MKNLLLTAVATLALAGVAGAAQAQDFSGFYVGGQAGFISQKGDNNETVVFDRNLDGQFNDTVTTPAGANAFSPGFCGGAALSPTPFNSCRDDDESFDIGARAGYDWQFGNWVFGVVGEISAIEVDDSVSAFSTTPANYTFSRDAEWVGGLRGRVGYAMADNLVYVTGGAAYAKVNHGFSTSNVTNSFTPTGADDNLTGFQAGIGVEHKMGEKWRLGLEYLYTSLNDDEYTVRAGAGTAGPANPFILAPNTTGTDLRRTDDFEFSSGRVTVSYRF